MSDDVKVSEYPEGLPPPDLGDAPLVARYGRNDGGRDFVVGDVHGMFAHLDALLKEVEFDADVDRLFSVGDLVDRGPSSHQALEWLAHPWFHACRGNHEQFAIDSGDPEQLEIWVGFNGGEWWLQLEPHEQERFRERFRRLPLAMEIDTRAGLIGVVHADVPPMLSWERFVDLLEARDQDASFYALWSRNRLQGATTITPVAGAVDRVYCGHTPTRGTVQIDNVWYIDTGAVYSREGFREARLTLIEVHPQPHREFSIDTNEPA